jgi:FtsP/CotA-like multicopper oxidase with cupredoxin domain
VTPGTSAEPRELNLVARDYAFVPSVVDLVPGETVVIRLINGGLDIHEAIFGDMDVQLAWEAAEGETVGHPPGPTPAVSVPPGLEGLRIVVASGERVDVTWTVPADAAEAAGGWFVGCHIPGHWQKGMVAPVRFVGADGVPIASPPPVPVATPPG